MVLFIPKGSLGGTIFLMGHTHLFTHAVRHMPPPDAQAKHRSNIRIMGLTPATWTVADSNLFLES
jgi:hypothetical protein